MGHLRNSDLEKHLAKNEKACSICGSHVISACPVCKAPLRGAYYARKPMYGSANYDIWSGTSSKAPIIGYTDQRIAHDVNIPAYCHNCGEPYPWTVARLQAFETIVDSLDDVSPELKTKLKEFFPDIITQTPRSELAVIFLEKALKAAGPFTHSLLEEWIKAHAITLFTILLNLAK